MIRPQLTLDLHGKLIVDNFAGGGGASTGIELALGRHVDHAINHDPKALGMHRINHPQTVHHCEDIFDIDPWTVTQGRTVGLCHNSPDCKHFSKAKGGKPLDKRIRGLCLVMLKWAKIRSEVMTMENVEEITTWGPLKRVKKNGEWGWYPDPEHKGRTWQAFLSILSTGINADHPDLPEILLVLGGSITLEECVRGFGYHYQAREIRACDAGAPTIRKRLYMIARCDGHPIIWPEATHANPKERRLQSPTGSRLKPWRTIAECLDWNLPCPSIFLEGAEAKAAKCRRPLAASTLRRIATGIDRYVLKSEKPFLVSLTHQGGDNRVEAIDEPARTLTGAHRGEKALVAPSLQKFHGDHQGRSDGSQRNHSVEDPLLSQDTSNRFGLTESTLAPMLTEHANASTQRNMPADEPMRTQCSQVKGGHFAVVSGTVVGAGGRAAQSRPRGLDETHHTTTSKADSCLASATLIGAGGPSYSGKPKPVDVPMNAQTTENHAAVASASLVKLRGEVDSHPNAGDIEEPGHTISAGGQHHGVLAAFMAQHNAGFNDTVGHPADAPISTISQKGSQQQVVAGSLAAYYGNDEDGQAVEEPARTVTTRERFGFVESSLHHGMTPEQLAGARRVAAFLREHGVEFEGEFATVKGGWVIVDIGMRMLTPRELYRAQGFPETYIIDKAWLVNPQTGAIVETKLTKEEMIRMCGNSVCPPVMQALVAANVPYLAAWYKGEQKRPRAILAVA